MRFSGTAALLILGLVTMASARDVQESGPAADGSPAWFIDHAADIHVHNYETMCTSDAARFCAGKDHEALRICLSSNKSKVSQTCQTALACPGRKAVSIRPTPSPAPIPFPVPPKPPTIPMASTEALEL